MLEGNGFILDIEGSRLKVYNKILFFKVGDWEKLPTPNYIAVTKVKYSKTVSTPKLMGNQSCTSDFSSYKYCVFVCEDKRKKKLLFKGEYEEALAQASLLSDYLNTSIVDYTK